MAGTGLKDLAPPESRFDIRELMLDLEAKVFSTREQLRRRRMLLEALNQYPYDLNRRRCRRLARRLKQVGRRCRQRCSSPLYVRRKCIRITGAILKLAHNHGGWGAVSTFHVWTRSGRIKPDELAGRDARAYLNAFRSAVLRAAKARGDRSGWLICFLDGEYEPFSGEFRIHFHGVGSGGLIEAIDGPLRDMGDYNLSRAIEVTRGPESLPRAVSYTMKRYWKSTPRPPGQGAWKARRIPEPMHSQVLLWLDRYTMDDICLKIGLRVDRRGDFVFTKSVHG